MFVLSFPSADGVAAEAEAAKSEMLASPSLHSARNLSLSNASVWLSSFSDFFPAPLKPSPLTSLSFLSSSSRVSDESSSISTRIPSFGENGTFSG